MRLCGMNESEFPHAYPCTAERIDQTTKTFSKSALAYDPADVRGFLGSTVDDANAILTACQSQVFFDLTRKEIPRHTVQQELSQLSLCLHTIITVANRVLGTPEGQHRWVNENNREDTLTEKLRTLGELANSLTAAAQVVQV